MVEASSQFEGDGHGVFLDRLVGLLAPGSTPHRFHQQRSGGQEGQTPPAYKDLEGLVGEYSNEQTTRNDVVNTRNTFEEKSPWEIERITIAAVIDGMEYVRETGSDVWRPASTSPATPIRRR